ncbi:MAG: hypothetical protein Q4A28_02850 [Brachymonas sp.]|nr:hypothetical protein [Brachymonas sp.]
MLKTLLHCAATGHEKRDFLKRWGGTLDENAIHQKAQGMQKESLAGLFRSFSSASRPEERGDWQESAARPVKEMLPGDFFNGSGRL